ncbi:MAG: DUF4760 domain-containing protein [Pseudomonadota bacterium]
MACDVPVWLDLGTRPLGPLLAAGVTAVIAWRIAKKTIMQQRVIARRRATIDFIEKRKWDSDYLAARQTFILLRDDKDRSIAYWAEADQKDRPERTTIRNILNDYELVAIGMKEDIFDEQIYRKWWRGTLLEDWKKSLPFIKSVQDSVQSKIYTNFQELAEAWNEGRNYHQKTDKQ